MTTPKRTMTVKKKKPTPGPVDPEKLATFFGDTPDDGVPLFAEPAPRQAAFVAPLTPLRACAVCERPGQRAHPDHAVCTACVENAARMGLRLAGQRRMVVQQQHDAARQAQAAWSALTEDERTRWGAFATLSDRARHGPALTEDEVRKLAATTAAYRAPEHPRISETLRRYYHADEALYWANATNEGRQRQLDIVLASLALCLEDMNRHADADALYTQARSVTNAHKK